MTRRPEKGGRGTLHNPLGCIPDDKVEVQTSRNNIKMTCRLQKQAIAGNSSHRNESMPGSQGADPAALRGQSITATSEMVTTAAFYRSSLHLFSTELPEGLDP